MDQVRNINRPCLKVNEILQWACRAAASAVCRDVSEMLRYKSRAFRPAISARFSQAQSFLFVSVLLIKLCLFLPFWLSSSRASSHSRSASSSTPKFLSLDVVLCLIQYGQKQSSYWKQLFQCYIIWELKKRCLKHNHMRLERKEKAKGGKITSCHNMLGVGCWISAVIEGQMQSPAIIMGFKQRSVITSALGWTLLVNQTASLDYKSSLGLCVRHFFICRVLHAPPQPLSLCHHLFPPSAVI